MALSQHNITHFSCKWHSYEKIKFGECLLQQNLKYLSSRLISKNLRIKIYDTTTLFGVSNGFQINMNVSYPKGTRQIEVISKQTAKQNAWAWKKGRDSNKKSASEDIRNSVLFMKQQRVKKSRKMWWLEH